MQGNREVALELRRWALTLPMTYLLRAEVLLMAWLEQHPSSGHFKICFRWGGKKKRKSLPVTDPKAAQAILLRFEENVALLERGRLELPTSGDIMTFLLSDGKLASSPKSSLVQPKTLREIVDRYLAALSHGSIEANSLETVRMHLNQAVQDLKADTSFDRKWLVNDPLRHPSSPNDIAEWLELWVTSNETDRSDG